MEKRFFSHNAGAQSAKWKPTTPPPNSRDEWRERDMGKREILGETALKAERQARWDGRLRRYNSEYKNLSPFPERRSRNVSSHSDDDYVHRE